MKVFSEKGVAVDGSSSRLLDWGSPGRAMVKSPTVRETTPTISGRRLVCGWFLVVLAVACSLSAASAQAAAAEPAAVRELRELVEQDISPRHFAHPLSWGSPAYVRGCKASALLMRLRNLPERRAPALLMLQKYREGLSEDYFFSTCLAALYLGQIALKAPLTPEERAALTALSGKAYDREDSLSGQATASLAEDNVRGLPPEEQVHGYMGAFTAHTRASTGFYLIHEADPPAFMRTHMLQFDRFAKDGKLGYEGRPYDIYFRYRRMKFASQMEELQFLWNVIHNYYRTAAKSQADAWNEGHYHSAQAATARMIDIGEPAVTFIVSHPAEILSAGRPGDVRYDREGAPALELWVGLTTLDPRLIAFAETLKNCGSSKVEFTAKELLTRIKHQAPYAFIPGNIYLFRWTNGH